MFRRLALLVLATLALPATASAADCSLKCDAMLVLADCTPAPKQATKSAPQDWSQDAPLRATAQCQQCCPGVVDGGAGGCTPQAPSLTLLQDGQGLTGAFKADGTQCQGVDVFVLSNDQGGKLAAGTYQLSVSSVLTVAFAVTGSGGVTPGTCQTDADCPICGYCMGGTCGGPIPAACNTASDCPAGQTCAVDPKAPCKNVCKLVPPCASDKECGACMACKMGVCGGALTPACSSDADCGAGKVCAIVPEAPCQNAGVADAPKGCAGANDCAACQICANGSCAASNLPIVCSKDADCPGGGTCAVQAAAPCQNACVAPAADAGAADAGADTASHDAGDDAGPVEAGGLADTWSDVQALPDVPAPEVDAAGTAGATAKKATSGCSAARRASSGAAWELLLLLASMALLRQRQRH